MMSDKPVIDRTVSLSLILALVIQTASALHWVGATEARLGALEAKAEMAFPTRIRLARLEEQMEAQQRSLLRIERALVGDAP